jgi:hypothetical protein
MHFGNDKAQNKDHTIIQTRISEKKNETSN